MRIPDMKKVRLGVAVLATLLLGAAVPAVASAGTGDDASVNYLRLGSTNVVSNGKVEMESGKGWDYISASNTLLIDENLKITYSSGSPIDSDGDLDIVVDSGCTLTLENTKTSYATGIHASGNVTLEGGGTIAVSVAATEGNNYGIYAGGGLTVSSCNLDVKCTTNNGAIYLAGNGTFTIENATVTANGACKAGEVMISGNSHVKVSSESAPVIGNTNGSTISLAGDARGYYWRTADNSSSVASTSFTKKTDDSGSAMTVSSSTCYFEYIGAGHVDKDHGDQINDTYHKVYCKCPKDSEVIASTAVGSEEHDCDEGADYHSCSACGYFDESKVVATVAATVDGESVTHSYTAKKFGNAIDFAENHPGAVLTMCKTLEGESGEAKAIDGNNANVTIDLKGNNLGKTLAISDGKVTVKNSAGSGTLSGIQMTGGTVNLEGGTITDITITNGQLNWESSTVTVTGAITCSTSGTITVNQAPTSELSIVVPPEKDLSKPLVVASNGAILSKDKFSITMKTTKTGCYTLEPIVENGQLYARFPLTQLDENDIVLDASASLIYDGKEKEPSVTVQRYMEQDEDGNATKGSLTEDTDYTLTYANNVNAGTATVTITGKGVYTDKVEKTFTIAKAAPEKSELTLDSRIYSSRVDKEDNIKLTAYLPEDYGAITNAVVTKTTGEGTVTYSTNPAVDKDTGKLSYTTQQNSSAGTGTITVVLSTTNYKDITISIPIETKDLGSVKLADGSTVTLSNGTLTAGEKLSTLKFDAANFVGEDGKTVVSGTLTFRTPDAVPEIGTLEAEWVFQPTDGENYAPVYGTVTVTVKEKTSSGSGSSGGSSSGVAGTTTSGTDTTGTTDSEKTTGQDDQSSGSEELTIAYPVSVAKKDKGTVRIPKTIVMDGVRYQVTSIGAKDFAGNKKVERIILPKYITAIGTKAFANCPKLKTITINSKKLTAKNVSAKAFSGIKEGTRIRVPKKMLARYKKLFAKKGLSSKVKVVAIKK